MSLFKASFESRRVLGVLRVLFVSFPLSINFELFNSLSLSLSLSLSASPDGLPRSGFLLFFVNFIYISLHSIYIFACFKESASSLLLTPVMPSARLSRAFIYIYIGRYLSSEVATVKENINSTGYKDEAAKQKKSTYLSKAEP